MASGASHVADLGAQVLQHHLDRVARRAEHDGRHALPHEVGRQVDRRFQGAGADAELLVHDRRVVEVHLAARARRAGAVDQGDLGRLDADEARGVLARVADGGGGADELRIFAVKARDAPQPREHVRHVRAEHAAVGVELVEHHVAQALEEVRPARVVGQDPGVEHVGVGEHDAAALARGAPRVARGVAVEDRRRRGHVRVAQEARAGCAPDRATAPWSGRGRARSRPDLPRAPGRRAGGSTGSCRSPWAWRRPRAAPRAPR